MSYLKYVVGSIAALSTLMLGGCSQKPVKCYGVSKDGSGHWIAVSGGACKKIAGATAKPMTTTEMKAFKPYPYKNYVKCYGIAAAGMNDCGTKTSACGGSVHIARSPDAWIALPKGVCEQLKGGKVVTTKHQN